MKLHTTMTSDEVHRCLFRAKAAGHVTLDVHFIQFKAEGSRTHPYGYLAQLGTYDQRSLPAGYRDQRGHRMNVRRYKNSGDSGATSGCFGGNMVWAATWHEWGHVIAELFDADPTASYGHYKSAELFHEMTEGQFRKPAEESAPCAT